MNVSKRNHYLPQFYLDSFLLKEGPNIFWVYDKNSGAPRPQTPINTGIERNLYNFERADGSIDDSIERILFSTIDGFSSQTIREILPDRARLTKKIIAELSGFVAFMATRVPRNIQMAQELGDRLARFHLLKLSKDPKKSRQAMLEMQDQGKLGDDFNVEKALKIFSKFDQHFKISVNEKISLAMSLEMTKTIHQQLSSMNWCLCRAPSGIDFITGDAPLVCFVLEADGRAIFGGGYGLNGAEVTLPISPKKCLYLDRKHNQSYRAVSKKVVLEINKRTAWAADKFIISTHKSKYIQGLLNWSAASVKNPKMDKQELYRRFELKGLFD